ncbi:hypothetical protein ABZ863_03995 [Saccharomonospora sp. NPDC046836]|uniref:hypothetical protein n=1 Tax=Saccharomonospora sp. NPDC046836 TaxID=3156921 RepID=UPI0033EEA62C
MAQQIDTPLRDAFAGLSTALTAFTAMAALAMLAVALVNSTGVALPMESAAALVVLAVGGEVSLDGGMAALEMSGEVDVIPPAPAERRERCRRGLTRGGGRHDRAAADDHVVDRGGAARRARCRGLVRGAGGPAAAAQDRGHSRRDRRW